MSFSTLKLNLFYVLRDGSGVIIKEAIQIMSDAYDRWARELLGAPPFNNAEVCKAEIGWNLSAEGKAVYEAALVRCVFWKQSRDTLAGHHLFEAHVTAENWVKISLARIEQWGILDWPEWASDASGHASYIRNTSKTL